MFIFALCFALFTNIAVAIEGDLCLQLDNSFGRCVKIQDCPSAIQLIQEHKQPIRCGFEGQQSFVCCDNKYRKKERKSVEYCEQQYPLQPGIVGGEDATAKEFPHMAALGFGTIDNIKWLCGGTLINEKYVVTAAHCIFTREFGQVKLVRLGDLDLTKDTDDASPKDFLVKRVIRHPEYKSSSRYHDIALIELNATVEFNEYMKPACLNAAKTTNRDVNYIATGWGLTAFAGEKSDILQKVELQDVPINVCKEKYQYDRRLQSGIVEDWQLCVGAPNKDTCQGDSGGPLTSKESNYHVIYGVTSFGKACGLAAGVYTKIVHYLSWIEDIVWPNPI